MAVSSFLYEVDDDEVPTVLRREEYGGVEVDEYGSWVLYEPTADGGEPKGDAHPGGAGCGRIHVGRGRRRFQAVSPFFLTVS